MDKVEAMIKEEGCTGKRVTKELIESRIEEVDYQTVIIAGQKMMFCGIRMQGGFVALGKSVCVDPDNWRDNIGREVSYSDAFSQLWAFEAYHMMYHEVPVAEHDLQGFTAVLDNNVMKHVCLIANVDIHQNPVNGVYLAKLVNSDGVPRMVPVQGEPNPTDYLVVLDTNLDDCYVCPADVWHKKSCT